MGGKALLCLVFCLSISLSSQQNNDSAKKLFRDYFNWKQDRWPLHYNIKGFSKNLTEIGDLSAESFAQQNQSCAEFYDRAKILLDKHNAEIDDVRTRRHLRVLMRETQACFQNSDFKVSQLFVYMCNLFAYC